MPPKKFFETSSPIALVTGGAGFIGSYLCESLLKKNVRVICVDSWQTGVRENISNLTDNPNFFLLEHDISKKITTNFERLDYIVHLAGIEAYINGEDVSVETLEANSLGVKNLLDLAKEHQARFLLASSIDVYSMRISNTSASSGAFSHHEAKRFAEALTVEYSQKRGVDTRVVRISDVYGPRMMLSTGNVIARLIRQAVYNEPLLVPNDTQTLYPVYITDVVRGIERSLFSAGTKNKIVTLAGPPVSIASIAEAIRAIKPNTQIQFLRNSELTQGRDIPTEALMAGQDSISWSVSTTLSEGLSATLDWFVANKKHTVEITTDSHVSHLQDFWSEPKRTKINKDVKKRLTFKIHPLLYPIIFVFLISLWLFVLPIIEILLGKSLLFFSKNRFLSNDFTSSRLLATVSQDLFSVSRDGFSSWFLIPGARTQASRFSKEASVGFHLARVATEVDNLAFLGKELLSSLFGGKPAFTQTVSSSLVVGLKALERELAFLEAEGGLSFKKVNDLASFREDILGLADMLSVLDTVVGVDAKKNYLVVLQDTRQLRPTGGVIQAVGLLGFDNGRITEFNTEESLSLDKRLEGQVDPPAPFKKYLKQTNWFLKDSGWSPDFPTSAKRAAWFVGKEVGKSTNGVIGVNSELLRILLRAVGRIEIEDMDTTLTYENFYQEADRVAGLGTKKEGSFFAKLAKKLFEEISQNQDKYLAAISKAILLGHDEKNIALWAGDGEVDKVIKQAGWSGSVNRAECFFSLENSCLASSVYLVEAAMGDTGNSAELERAYSLDISYTSQTFSHKLLVSYKNKGGDYKNYLRLFLPSKAVGIQATLVLPEGGQQKLDIDDSIDAGERSVGMFMDLPSGDAKVLISWNISMTIAKEGKMVFLWQKQPGTYNIPIWLKINMPNGFSLAPYPMPTLTTANSVGYNTTLSRDINTELKWQQNE